MDPIGAFVNGWVFIQEYTTVASALHVPRLRQIHRRCLSIPFMYVRYPSPRTAMRKASSLTTIRWCSATAISAPTMKIVRETDIETNVGSLHRREGQRKLSGMNRHDPNAQALAQMKATTLMGGEAKRLIPFLISLNTNDISIITNSVKPEKSSKCYMGVSSVAIMILLLPLRAGSSLFQDRSS